MTRLPEPGETIAFGRRLWRVELVGNGLVKLVAVRQRHRERERPVRYVVATALPPAREAA